MKREPAQRTYRHFAFKIREDQIAYYQDKIRALQLDMLLGRTRHFQDGQSLYFYDYDNHLFELHTGTLQTHLDFNKYN